MPDFTGDLVDLTTSVLPTQYGVDPNSMLIGALPAGLLWLWGIVSIVALVLVIVGMRKTFQKAGRKGREAVIPFWNSRVLVKISGSAQRYFWAILITTLVGVFFKNVVGITLSIASIVLIILSIASIVLSLIVWIELSGKFKRHRAFAVGLLLLPFIFFPILGFGKAKYQASKPTK